MVDQGPVFLTHLKKSIVWLAGSTLFGFAPLIFLYLINWMSEENLCAREIDYLLSGGFVVFVFVALTGTVVFDLLKARFRVSGWTATFAIYISPFCVLTYVFLKYMLKYVQYADQAEFGLGSTTARLSVGFMILYCLFVKTIYYLKQNAGNDNDIRYPS
ncbi:MAG TPA: hypothetical protein VK618_09115 [Flavitalea sp.]|nr:hypothetical protein [Flavitalea sp.]